MELLYFAQLVSSRTITFDLLSRELDISDEERF